MTGHPWWCAGEPWCGLREHRSPPQQMSLPWGGLVVTRVQGVGQEASHLEVRLSVALPVDEVAARTTAEVLAAELDQAVEAARVAGAVGALR